jgi:hypothetical protein
MDNCPVNKAIANVLKKKSISACCHRLNLAFDAWPRYAFDGDLQLTLDQIHAVMKRASSYKGRAALRVAGSVYEPWVKLETGWMENANMAGYLLKSGHFAHTKVEDHN